MKISIRVATISVLLFSLYISASLAQTGEVTTGKATDSTSGTPLSTTDTTRSSQTSGSDITTDTPATTGPKPTDSATTDTSGGAVSTTSFQTSQSSAQITTGTGEVTTGIKPTDSATTAMTSSSVTTGPRTTDTATTGTEITTGPKPTDSATSGSNTGAATTGPVDTTTGRPTTGTVSTSGSTTGTVDPCAQCTAVGQICVDGKCRCKPGWVLNVFTKRCVQGCTPCDNIFDLQAGRCGCPLGQYCAQEADGQVGRCRCNPGTRLDDNGNCIPIVDPLPSYALCSASGDPHYQTFDNFRYDDQGRCDYVFARNWNYSFEVHIRTGECRPQTPIPTVSCAEALAFKTSQETVEFYQDQAFANSVPLTASTTLASGVIFTYRGAGSYLAQFPDGASVDLNGFSATVGVPATSNYYTIMEGLCGNFDSNAANDTILRDRATVVNVIQVFTEEWVVASPDSILFITRPNQANCSKSNTNPGDLCDDEAAKTVCNVDFLQYCADYTDLTEVYINCIRDYCEDGEAAAVNYLNSVERYCNSIIPKDCEPECQTGQVCVWDPVSATGRCVQHECDANCDDTTEVCVTVAVGDLNVDTCNCKPGFKRTDRGCISVDVCDDVICDGEGQICVPQRYTDDAGNVAVTYACICSGNLVFDIVNRKCVPPTTEPPGINQPCTPCEVTGQTNCGCKNNLVCTTFMGKDRSFCQCPDGLVPDPNGGDSCIDRPVIPPAPAICGAYGDPHYITFDHVPEEYQIKCDHLAVGGMGREIQVRHRNCWDGWWNPDVSCVRGVAFRSDDNNHVIEFNDEDQNAGPRVFVDNVQVTTFPHTVGGTIVDIITNQWGQNQLAGTFPDGLRVSYTQYYSMEIYAPVTYYNQSLNGTCGNYNGLGTDEQLYAPFVLEPSTSIFMTPNVDCSLICANPPCGGKRQTGGSLPYKPNCVLTALPCNSILTLKDTYPGCDQLVDLNRIFTNCVFDSCATGGLSQVYNATIGTAASRCSELVAIYNEYLPTGTPTGSEGTTGDKLSSASTYVASLLLIALSMLLNF